uniref:Hypothetical conserved protein n=1 Tax=uncultured Chloroflexota bacterium TaxID=166587 RepID=H5S8P5_9CHLR|nr:hypothetical conserved protein [uncultured Chloroflexota bacterium]
MSSLPLESLSPPWSFAGLAILVVARREVISDRLYRILARLLEILFWGGELEGIKNLPEEGPAVFIANHLGALGPIAIVASLPVRVYPWIIADMVDEQKAAAYLNQDFTEPQLHLPPPLSLWFSRLLSRITVPLLRAFGCIPVYHDPERLYSALEESLHHLEQGHFLLIFPEDPAQPRDPLTHMTPFYKGFTRLGEMFYQRCKKVLKFYPLAVSGIYRIVRVGEPVAFNPLNPVAIERIRLKQLLENSVRSMYLDLHTPALKSSHV